MPTQHILIVDDQKEVSSVLRSGLESLGQDLHVSELLSGEEAILELGGSFESLAYHATLFGGLQFVLMLSLLVLAGERLRDLGFASKDMWRP